MIFATAFCALYAAHHVGDYWAQTDHQAAHKGATGREGRIACLMHVMTYVITQALFLGAAFWVTGRQGSLAGWLGALLVSGVTHYLADRREHGIMFRLARLLPGKERFLRLGVPREDVSLESWSDCPDCSGRGAGGAASDESTNGRCWTCRGGGRLPTMIGDNPSLGTGAWALDQSWHLFWGVFVAALILAGAQ